MMSAAGTPSTDPWVILVRERVRYEEQFRSLKPVNGVVTGEQAKGFFLQSQLPPMVLGQIWALADTDADGKMDINEFSIACKLINLKLRGYEVPKGLPPSLLASLKGNTPPAIPPLPNPALVSAPPRPEPPKIAPMMTQPLMQSQPLIPNLTGSVPNQIPTVPPLKPAVGPMMTGMVAPISMAPTTGGIPTGIVPPMQATVAPMQVGVAPVQAGAGVMSMQSSISSMQSGISTMPTSIAPMHTSSMPTTGIAPMQSGIAPMHVGGVPPMQVNAPLVQPGVVSVQPLVSGIPPMPALPKMTTQSTVGTTGFGTPLVSGVPYASTASLISSTPLASTIPTMTSMAPMATGTGITGVPEVIPTAGVAPHVTSTMSPAIGSAVASTIAPGGPGATSTPRASVTSLDRAASIESPQVDWAVPHHIKLKYTQIFNTTDRTRTGYLSGAQARNVMVQTKLPQNLLAQIWALSDMDSDGRLGCEEFVLAMHLCEQASLGNPPPTKLPPDLVPPSFRRTTRTASISSQGSAPADQDPASTLLQTTFEDKRKENFEKGQAELERRRKTLLDQQRKEAEERERKEREEQDRIEKARQEAERKRLEELEKQMREQQEQERQKEEERKRQAEQREAARREMERQRQLEWEKQRLQELQQQRQKEQENVLKLKAKNQSLTIELSSLNEQVKELSQKICDTRVGVSNVKTTIDGMRSTRDTQMQEMSQLKNKLKEQNAKLLALSQEKVKLEAKNKLNAQLSGQDAEQARLAFENKEITIKNLRQKIEDMQREINSKLSDIENNNSQLTNLRTELTTLVNQCESLYSVYEIKRDKVLEMKGSNKKIDYNSTWREDAWGDDGKRTEAVSEWPVDNWSTTTQSVDIAEPIQSPVAGMVRYRALYEFVARNSDEISFQPGDIINVPTEQTGEPGWLAGQIRGHTGWFPESYVEPVDDVGVQNEMSTASDVIGGYADERDLRPLEGIAEVPESNYDMTEITPVAQPMAVEETNENYEYYIANFPYQSQEQGDLTFNAGEIITVIKKDGDWWTGKIGDTVGIFPSNYVQKVDMNSSGANTTTTAPPATEPPASEPVAVSDVMSDMSAAISDMSAAISDMAAAPCTDITNAQIDNEVSQIIENKSNEKSIDSPSIGSNTQFVKSKKPEIASVIAPYQATSSEQLSLARGQLIMIRKKTDTGWWEGELQAKGRKRQVGWFPASYVKVLNSSGRTSGRSTPVSTTRMQQEVIIDKVIALYPYTAANPDELSFAKDDIISVTAREEEAWWRGELNGVSGLFPSNYVAPLQQQCKPPAN